MAGFVACGIQKHACESRKFFLHGGVHPTFISFNYLIKKRFIYFPVKFILVYACTFECTWSSILTPSLLTRMHVSTIFYVALT
jgi:hypothetical protein